VISVARETFILYIRYFEPGPDARLNIPSSAKKCQSFTFLAVDVTSS
jgi:hypothetical protein